MPEIDRDCPRSVSPDQPVALAELRRMLVELRGMHQEAVNFAARFVAATLADLQDTADTGATKEIRKQARRRLTTLVGLSEANRPHEIPGKASAAWDALESLFAKFETQIAPITRGDETC